MLLCSFDEVLPLNILKCSRSVFVILQGVLGDSLRRSATVTIEANDDPYGYFVIIDSQRPVRIDESAGCKYLKFVPEL